MKRIKIKKFSNKSQSAAMKAYNLTNEEYDQVNAYIRENNISSDSTILVEETPDGIAISTCDADDNGVQQPANQSHCPSGNYVKATFEPGKAPLIQGSTTDPLISKGFAIIVLVASAVIVFEHVTRVYFDIKDQIAARANGKSITSGNTLSN